jgi:hypothetical protein
MNKATQDKIYRTCMTVQRLKVEKKKKVTDRQNICNSIRAELISR